MSAADEGCCDHLHSIPQVLFTGVVDSRGERAVLALGGSLASSVNEASHLVTDRIRRTVKFLCALGKGIPILSLNWLYQVRSQKTRSGRKGKARSPTLKEAVGGKEVENGAPVRPRLL